jgi:hypothetical protein
LTMPKNANDFDTPSQNLQNIQKPITHEPHIMLISHWLKHDKCSRWPYTITNPLGDCVGPSSLGWVKV